MTANDIQVGGDHYKKGAVQHWDWAQNLPYLEGNATKYIGRHMDKNGLADLEKAMHYIQKIAEEQYGVNIRWTVGTRPEPGPVPEPEPGNIIRTRGECPLCLNLGVFRGADGISRTCSCGTANSSYVNQD